MSFEDAPRDFDFSKTNVFILSSDEDVDDLHSEFFELDEYIFESHSESETTIDSWYPGIEEGEIEDSDEVSRQVKQEGKQDGTLIDELISKWDDAKLTDFTSSILTGTNKIKTTIKSEPVDKEAALLEKGKHQQQKRSTHRRKSSESSSSSRSSSSSPSPTRRKSSRRRYSSRKDRDKDSDRKYSSEHRRHTPEHKKRSVEREKRSPEQRHKYKKRRHHSDSLSSNEDYKKEKITRDNDYKVPLDKIKQENELQMPIPGLGVFDCDICHITMNSEQMLRTHMVGKRHIKNMKSMKVSEMALETLKRSTKAVQGVDNRDLSEPTPGVLTVQPGKKHLKLKIAPMLQAAIDEMKVKSEVPICGLEYIYEILGTNEIRYQCTMCGAPCNNASVLPHLRGFNHRLRFWKMIDPHTYERKRFDKKSVLERMLNRAVRDYLALHSEKTMKVVKEIDEPWGYDEAGPSGLQSHSNESGYPNQGPENEEMIMDPDCVLSFSTNDLYCQICDAHMNNEIMWHAHIRGKRHLKNLKKLPGEPRSKVKTTTCQNESDLERKLRGYEGVIVGLNFIKETQNLNGNTYNCYLCSASLTVDIDDHILSSKHMFKYLEYLHKNQKESSYKTIMSLKLSKGGQESLIYDECSKMMEKYGPGKVEVHVPLR